MWKSLKNGSRYHGLQLCEHHISISSSAYRELGTPERMNIEYDKELSAVKLIPGDEFKVNALKGVRINCNLSREMPTGKYLLEEGIFKLN